MKKILLLLIILCYCIPAQASAPDRRISDNDGDVAEITSGALKVTFGGAGTQVEFPGDILITDDNDLLLGDSSDAVFTWNTAGGGNSALQIGLASPQSFSILQKADIGHANRVTASMSQPTLFVWGADETDATDVVQIYHDGTYGVLDGGGSLKIDAPNQFYVGSSQANSVEWQTSGGLRMYGVRTSTSLDQTTMYVDDNSGNHIVIATGDQYSRDYDHAETADPTLFIHSNTNPDTDNSQWLSFTHNKTNGVISVGKGMVSVAGGLVATGIIASVKVTGDPCGDTTNYPEASLWYNDTSDVYCYCDGSGVDKKVSDDSACF